MLRPNLLGIFEKKGGKMKVVFDLRDYSFFLRVGFDDDPKRAIDLCKECFLQKPGSKLSLYVAFGEFEIPQGYLDHQIISRLRDNSIPKWYGNC